MIAETGTATLCHWNRKSGRMEDGGWREEGNDGAPLRERLEWCSVLLRSIIKVNYLIVMRIRR